MEDLITLPEVATELKIPISTVRYYVKSFQGYFNPVGNAGAKRYKRYPLDTLDKIQIISQGMKDNLTHLQIDTSLKQAGYEDIIDVDEVDSAEQEGKQEDIDEVGFIHQNKAIQESMIKFLQQVVVQQENILLGQEKANKDNQELKALLVSKENMYETLYKEQSNTIKELQQQINNQQEQLMNIRATIEQQNNQHKQQDKGILNKVFKIFKRS